MKTRKILRCVACGKRIRDHQPDLVLRDLESGSKRYYHTTCGSAAYRAAMNRPAVYVLTTRHVDGEAN